MTSMAWSKPLFFPVDQTHLEYEWNLVEIMIQVVLLSPKSSEDRKERSSPKIERHFFPKSGEDQKNGLHRNLALYSAGTGRIYLCYQALFCLIIQRWTLDGGRVPPTI